MARILGIDPGYGRCGFAVIEGSGVSYKCLIHGVITTSKGETLERRLLEIGRDLEDIIENYQPEKMAIEQLFFAKSTTTALKVAEARGVITMIAAKYELEVVHVKPNEVKLAVAGYGGADKRQIQEMVKVAFKLDAVPKPDDAADALAVALTGATKARYE
jgi:crossover junction endodeoxyribonuclease RuvC